MGGCATRASGVERVMGIEPTFSAWEADVLPLNYTRMDEPEFYCIATASQRRSQGGQGVCLRQGRSATGVVPTHGPSLLPLG